MSTLAMFEDGQRSERVEYGERLIRDSAFGKRGAVNPRPNDWNPYDGAWYAGGPKMFEIVQRTIVTYTGGWKAAGSADRVHGEQE